MFSAWLTVTAASAPGGRDVPLLWATLPLVAAILLGAALIASVKKWRQQQPPPRLTASDQLAQFRSLYERGEMSAEEFGRVRALLTARLKREMDVPGEPPADDLPSAEADETPPAPAPESPRDFPTSTDHNKP